MARDTKTITENWVSIASGVATFTITKKGKGALYFNTQADDVNVLPSFPSVEDQSFEDEARATFCRAELPGSGWEILVDGAL